MAQKGSITVPSPRKKRWAIMAPSLATGEDRRLHSNNVGTRLVKGTGIIECFSLIMVHTHCLRGPE